jgi:hypothetical protein
MPNNDHSGRLADWHSSEIEILSPVETVQLLLNPIAVHITSSLLFSI